MIEVAVALILLAGVLSTWAILSALADGTFKDAPPPDPRTRIILTGGDRVER